MNENRRRPNMSFHKTPMREQPIPERLKNFEEVALGYTVEEARQEAERCLNCPERYCARHCPAHNYIPEFIAEIRCGDLEAAWRRLSQTNPFMEVSGRVCPYECQCEGHCTRGIKSEPVAIGRLERFVADWHRKECQLKTAPIEPAGKRVAIVGAGPAGMTCALSLSNAGFQVTVYEKTGAAGGVAGWGIPPFVLPRHIVGRLFEQMIAQGVIFKANAELGRDISLAQLREENDAVFVATGAELPVSLALPGSGLPQVAQAKDYLTRPEGYDAKDVIVLGGGNTAIDAARTALRCGAESVRIVYRRMEEDMPATMEERRVAKMEGAQIIPLTAPVCFLEKDGALSGVECDVMELTEPDYPGGRNNVRPGGKRIVLDCDLAVLALGFSNLPVEGLPMDSRNRILVNKDYSTSADKVYAGGDAVNGSSTLMKAVTAGKDAAASIYSNLIGY